jgi:predicted phosphoribosyltransferase
MRFNDRIDAGRQLAEALLAYGSEDAVVYALPRGGVVLGAEIASALRAPLDLAIARKVGHPEMPEYAVCAVGEDDALMCNKEERTKLDPEWLDAAVRRERLEAQRRRMAYTGGKRISATGKRAILVDDGVATGLTLRAAIADIRAQAPRDIVAASPVAPVDVIPLLRDAADEVVILEASKYYLGAVGAYYADFPQVSDKEVLAILSRT